MRSSPCVGCPLCCAQNASDQKSEMERIQGKISHEVSKIEERKAKIDDELKEVQVTTEISHRL